MKQPQLWPSCIARASIFIAVGAVRCNKVASKLGVGVHAAFESWVTQGQWCCVTYSQTGGQWRALVRFGAGNKGRSGTSLAGDVESCLLVGICHSQCQRCYRPPPCNWFQLAYAWDLERCLSSQYWLLVFNGLPFVEEVILYHLYKKCTVCSGYHANGDHWNIAQAISAPWVLTAITCTHFQVYCEQFTGEVVGKSDKVAVFEIESGFRFLIKTTFQPLSILAFV